MDSGSRISVKLFLIVSNAGSQAAHRKAGTHDNRISEFGGSSIDFFHIVSDNRTCGFAAGFLYNFLEKLSVFTAIDCFQRSSDKLHIIFFQNAGFAQSDRSVKRSLPSQSRKKRVGTLFCDNPLENFGINRLDVCRIRHLRVSHNRSRIRVDQNNANAFFAQNPARLGSGIIKLGSLTYDNRTGSDNHYGFDVFAFRH